MLAYLMLFPALFNAVCLYNSIYILQLIFANAFCFHAIFDFIDTKFAYFIHYIASCTVFSLVFLVFPLGFLNCMFTLCAL